MSTLCTHQLFKRRSGKDDDDDQIGWIQMLRDVSSVSLGLALARFQFCGVLCAVWCCLPNEMVMRQNFPSNDLIHTDWQTD